MNNILEIKKDLENYSKKDVEILKSFYKIGDNKNVLLAIAKEISKQLNVAQMAPSKVFERYGEQLFSKIKIDPSIENKDPETIKQEIISNDPDGGKNVEWIVTSYINGGIHVLEDLPIVKSSIEKYNWLVKNKLIVENIKYKFFRTLVDFGGIDGYIDTKGHSRIGLLEFLKDYENVLQNVDKRVINKIVHYDGPDYMLIQPLNKETSCKYGANTKWCTAAKKDNKFEHYKQDLIILIPKNPEYPNQKYQIHHGSHSAANEKDKTVTFKTLFKKFPTLQDIYSTIILNSLKKSKNFSLADIVNDPIFEKELDKIIAAGGNEKDIEDLKRNDKVSTVKLQKFIEKYNIEITPSDIEFYINKSRYSSMVYNLLKNGRGGTLEYIQKYFNDTLGDKNTLTYALSRPKLFKDIIIFLYKESSPKDRTNILSKLDEGDIVSNLLELYLPIDDFYKAKYRLTDEQINLFANKYLELNLIQNIDLNILEFNIKPELIEKIIESKNMSSEEYTKSVYNLIRQQNLPQLTINTLFKHSTFNTSEFIFNFYGFADQRVLLALLENNEKNVLIEAIKTGRLAPMI
jgi:hypothetical protein